MIALPLLTRAIFVGRVAVLATGGLLSIGTPKTLCAMTSPDYNAWEALVKAHVKPSEIRGIGVNAVDYEGELQLRWFGTAYQQQVRYSYTRKMWSLAADSQPLSLGVVTSPIAMVPCLLLFVLIHVHMPFSAYRWLLSVL